MKNLSKRIAKCEIRAVLCGQGADCPVPPVLQVSLPSSKWPSIIPQGSLWEGDYTFALLNSEVKRFGKKKLAQGLAAGFSPSRMTGTFG